MKYPIPTRSEIPAIVSGYELDPARGWFALIVPEASTNLCKNPSFETDTNLWSAGAGTLSRVSTAQRFGTYAAKVQPSSTLTASLSYIDSAGGYIPTVPGQWYTVSLYFKGAGGQSYRIYWADVAGNLLGQIKTFTASNDWMRVSISYYETQVSIGRIFTIGKNNNANVFPFYVDGVLIENKAYATTYFDGDSVGYLPGVTDFYWSGLRHASTSVRSASTRAGGRPVKLKDLGFVLMAIMGLGVAPVQPISQPYGWQNGALYQRTRLPERDFTLAGYLSGATREEVMRTRANLAQYLLPNTDEPLLLQYEHADECGNTTGETLNIPCSYAGGLEGQTDNLYSEKVPLKFIQWLPLIQRDGQEGANLGYTQTISNTAFASARINGQWQALGTGFNNGVLVVRDDPARGRVWYGGAFTAGNGVTLNGIGYWENNTFVAIGGATKGVSGGSVYAIAIMPNGDAWLAGTFTAAGGSATKGVARWNNATNTFTVFNPAGTWTNFTSLAIDTNGNVFVGGDFTNWDGDAAQDYITEYTSAGAWAAVGTSPFSSQEIPYCMAVDAQNNLYVGSLYNGVAGHLRKWSGTAWSDLGVTTGTTTDASVRTIYIDTDGSIYIGGGFSGIAGLSIPYVAKYNGNTFLSLGTGLYGASGVYDIFGDGHGSIVFAGRMFILDIGTRTFALWNGSALTALDSLPPSNTYNAYGKFLHGNLFTGWFAEGSTSSTAAALTTITNTGTGKAAPIATFTGPGTLLWMRNETTGDLISFSLPMLAGEVVTLNLTNNQVTFISNFRGNIIGNIRHGSNDAGFHLVPGVNVISVFISGSPTAATAVDLCWSPEYLALEH